MHPAAFAARFWVLALAPAYALAAALLGYCVLSPGLYPRAAEPAAIEAPLRPPVPTPGTGPGGGVGQTLLVGGLALVAATALGAWLAHRAGRSFLALRAERDRALAERVARTDLVARVSHEVRTPLGGILGYARLLTDTPLDPRQREYVATIERSGRTLLRLANEILDFARAEHEPPALEQLDFDLRECVEEALGVVLPEARAKGLELTYSCDPEIPESVRGDRWRLLEVLGNLLSNAVRFTSEGSVAVEVAPAREGSMLRFGVSDTGSGISRVDQARLFQPFSQADGGRHAGGSGLGLLISRMLVERMGGELYLRSARGRGTTVSVLVPLRAAAGSVRPAPDDLLAGRTALLWETHPVTRRAVRTTLVEWGMNVTESTDLVGVARTLAGEPRPDVLLLGLPSGRPIPEGLDEVLTLAARGSPPSAVVLVGAEEYPATRVEPPGATATAWVAKPVRRRDLQQALRSVLSDAPGRVAPAETSGSSTDSEPDAGLLGARILLAEDSAVSRALTVAQLQAHGARVTVAEDGLQALERLGSETFDLVLMDLHLPGIGGAEVVARLRASAEDSERTPVVALTADAFEDTRRRLLGSGFDDCLTKPVEPRALLETVRRWLGRPPTQRPWLPGQESAPAPSVAIDRTSALRAAGARETLANELLGLLLADIRVQRARLVDAVGARDLAQAAEIAHNLAGGAAYCGALVLEEILRDLEETARLGDAQAAGQRLLDFQVEAQRVERAARTYVGDAGPASPPAADREQG
jgi:signal transduction histidine kinase/DNA-binding response OmpR family regulator